MRIANDKTVTCPYNSKHSMPEARFHWHLKECPDRRGKSHMFEVCPFNTTHHVQKHLLEDHKASCPDRMDSLGILDEMKEFLRKNPTNYSRGPAVHWQEEIEKPMKVKVKENPNDVYMPEAEFPDLQTMQIVEPPPGFEQLPQKSIPKVDDSQPLVLDQWVTITSKSKGKKPALTASEVEKNLSSDRGTPQVFDSFAQLQLGGGGGGAKKKKNLKKKLKEISNIEAKKARGEPLSPRELAKLNIKEKVEQELRNLNQ